MTSQLESVIAFVGDRSPAPAPEASGARVVVVGSGKGGVGTSTAACLLALVVAARGEKVLLVDASDGLGVQHLLLGLGDGSEPRATEDRVIPLREAVAPVLPNLSLLRAFAEPDRRRADGAAGMDRRGAIRRASGHFNAHDLVVVDGGSRLESVVGACEGGVSVLVAVTSSDRICLAATYALVKAIGMRLGDRPVAILGNRVDDEEGREAAALVETATRQFLGRDVAFAGSLPDDACLRAGVAAGMSVQDAAAGSPAAVAMHEVAGILMDELFPAGPSSGRRHVPWRS